MLTDPVPNPDKPTAPAGGMLPGMAAIALYLLFVSMFTAFQMVRAHGVSTVARCGVLAICTLVLVGVFGVLRMRRWGWALVTGGCLLGAVANFYAFHATHAGPYIIQGLFAMVFFLYLSRTEVRERMR